MESPASSLPPAAGSVRLKKFFVIVRFFAFAAVAVLAVGYALKSSFFTFIRYPQLFFDLLIGLIGFSALFYFLIVPHTRAKIVLYINNLVWALFMAGEVYASGGIHSPFILILTFPIITTAFDLEAEAALVVGAVISILWTLIFIFDGDYSLSALTLFLMIAAFLGIFAFYVYRIIKETLRQKYEKEETKRKYGELVEIDRAKSDFITATSHQLRTPLTEIKWSLNAAESTAVSEETRMLLSRSHESVNGLIGIVNEMLDVRSLERPEAIFNFAPLDCFALAQEIVAGFQGLAGQKRVVLELLGDRALISADRGKLKLALENVIDNAIRYSPGGKVVISVTTKENQVVCSIADTGIGIPADEMDRIFTKFFRGKEAISLEQNETGIGLYITKSIIEKHHGTITFTSTPGGGTTFVITIPEGESGKEVQ